ncbi:MAG: alpha-1,4-glucan--maltose-1-phosphate maltosyltransferase [Chloroflexota bacterium]|nr:alpha-1,4-glucan--maltose-1-phosphate maltosyltransferase [Chloroflexota bacterium]
MPEPHYRLSIPEVRPQISCGRHAVKRIVGEKLRVAADVIKEGHDTFAAEVRYRRPGETEYRTAPMTYSYEDDEWSGEVPLTEIGQLEYTVAAWTDEFASWTEEVRRKLEAGRDVASELLEGAQLIREAAARSAGEASTVLTHYADLITKSSPQSEQTYLALSPTLRRLMVEHQAQDDLTVYDRWLSVTVDRERARFGAWYEFFPRSQSPEPGRHGTLRDAELLLPRIKELGFDAIYLPPIHPIGVTNRKGRNNALVAEPGDVGSPWAIGSETGGHDTVHPELGTLDDFDAFVQAARAVGLEVVLDFAIQCSPDHPYVREHPEWFRRRPDGTIKYAENPPKRYEDIVAIDMWCEDWPNLWNELKRVVLHWVHHGVEIFRVDNPHTKPIAFWEWLIKEVKRDHPQVLFLSEAFTRPKRLQLLAKIGFSQSYTYFTWRNARWELEQFLTELTTEEQREFLRPNFFVNTQDILTEYLQHGGRPAFKIRLALAATLSPTYGVYSGFELIENEPLRPGSEEYMHSEKYELRQRDWNAPGNINDFVRQVNGIRRANRALQLYTNLTFHFPDNQSIIAYSKVSEDGSNRILVVVNLDPHNPQEATLHLNGMALGLDDGSRYVVHDLITDARYTWAGTSTYVRLDPHYEPVHIFRLEATTGGFGQ